jgi:hypothetical protein
MTEIAAFAACTILAGLVIFQLCLIAGAPLGKFAWGGAHTTLPTNLRIGSLISTILYGLFIIIILNRAGSIDIINNSLSSLGIWALTIYFFIGVCMNGISRSKPERNMMTPVALVLAVLCLLIALS